VNKSQIEATPSVVPRESVATPEDVARLLELTPEKIEELKREQLLALSRSRARLSDNERRVARGIELEQHYKLTGNRQGLAEALMLQGRYAEAAEVASTTEQKQAYLKKADAVTKEDAHCGCDRFVETGEHNLPQQYIESYGHSLKHGGEVPFIRCQTCGDLNAMPAPEHLLTQRALRNNPSASDRERASFFKR
jgi:hypothetical protein